MSDEALAIAREALAGLDADAWLVGGAVRDRLLGRPTTDLDLAVAGDVEAAARTLARAARAAVFPLSEDFGAWRVVARGGALAGRPRAAARRDDRAGPRAARLHAQRDRRAAAGGEPIDPTGGQADLAARRLRMVSAQAFDADPLRVLRLARFACELALEPEPATIAAAAQRAPAPRATSPPSASSPS